MTHAAGEKILAAEINKIYVDGTTFTPTINNFTLGNGTKTGRYNRRGRLCDVSIELVMGTTSSIGGTVSFVLPFPAQTDAVGRAWVLNAGTKEYPCVVFVNAGKQTCEVYQGTTGTGVVNATTPITFGSTDRISLTLHYLVQE